MANRNILYGLAFVCLITASSAQAKWRGSENSKKYDTLADCFKDNYSCRWVGRLVQVSSRDALVRAASTAASARAQAGVETLYYLKASRLPADRRGGGRSATGQGAATETAGCLTSVGTVHKEPCGDRDVRIEVAK